MVPYSNLWYHMMLVIIFEQNFIFYLSGAIVFYCWLQVVTSDREHLISEKQNNKASAEGARLQKEAMLLKDLFKFTNPSLDAFRFFGLISRACQGPRDSPNSINVDFYKAN